MNRFLDLLWIVVVSAMVTVNAAEPTDRPGSEDTAARVKAARDRLDTAAEEVAELAALMAQQRLDKFASSLLNDKGLGVQLAPQSDSKGARIASVSPGGAAAEAGFRPGDVIVGFNGTPISGPNSAAELAQLMRTVSAGTTVTVRIDRDGAQRDLKVRARQIPTGGPTVPDPTEILRSLADLQYGLALNDQLRGMELAALTPTLGHYFGTDKGVLVTRAPRDPRLMLRDGDIIVSIDGRAPRDGEHAARILHSYQPGEKLTLQIVRNRESMALSVVIPQPVSLADERSYR